MMKICLFLITIFLSMNIFSQEVEKAKDDDGIVDFKSIKKILKSDMLDDEVKKKQEKQQKIQKAKEAKLVALYSIPDEKEFWSFISEYWLVKNATLVKWNFQKPDYGIEDAFKEFLEKVGHFEVKFKILLLDTPNITHFALPSNPSEYIFLLSRPFIRTLDLSKLEIAILLYEDYLRARKGFFKSFVENKEIEKMLGSNFYGNKFNKKAIDDLMKKYDEIIFAKGFNFQQQFEVTQQIGETLKSDLKLWNVYRKMLVKIDDLIKSNILYQKYSKIYPSPELQINWLTPKKGL